MHEGCSPLHRKETRGIEALSTLARLETVHEEFKLLRMAAFAELTEYTEVVIAAVHCVYVAQASSSNSTLNGHRGVAAHALLSPGVRVAGARAASAADRATRQEARRVVHPPARVCARAPAAHGACVIQLEVLVGNIVIKMVTSTHSVRYFKIRLVYVHYDAKSRNLKLCVIGFALLPLCLSNRFQEGAGRVAFPPYSNQKGSDMSQAQDDAAATEGPEIVSEFPAPPAFFVLYRDGANQGPAPPEPMEPQYHMFGTPYSTQDAVPDLLPQEGRKLYLNAKSSAGSDASASSAKSEGAAADDTAGAAAVDGGTEKSKTEATRDDADRIDYKAEMKKINRSLLANFVELVDVLIKRPGMFNEKLDDMEQLFLNMHNLINAFRPHQARETIIEMLKAQIQERRDAAQDIRKTIDDSRKAVEQTHADLHDTGDDAGRADAVDVKMENVDGQDDDKTHNKALENGLLYPTGGHFEPHSARAQETRQMQDEFFSVLDAALES